LRRLLWGAVGGTLFVVIIAFFALAWGGARQLVEPAVERQLSERSASAAAVVESMVESAIGDAEVLALSPVIRDVAARGAELATLRGLDGLPVDELERRMAATRTLRASPATDRYLREAVDRFLFAEVFLTDTSGLVVAASGMTSDFVQRDEAWWQEAFAGRPSISDVGIDESSGALSLAVAVPVRGASGSTVGVMKAVIDLERLKPALGELARGWGYVQVIDDRGLLISDPNPDNLLKPHPDAGALVAGQLVKSRRLGDSVVGMARPALSGRWVVAYWVPEREAYDLLYAARRGIGWGLVIALATAAVGVLLAGGWISREVGRPLRLVAAAADRVGGGDLSIIVPTVGRGEVARLCLAVREMVERLKELVGSLRDASYHTQWRSQEIASAVDELSAGTEEMTTTIARLTGEAAQHSSTIQEVNRRMDELGSGARDLAKGAGTATERSRALRDVAERSRERLREGRGRVAQMAERSDLATSRLLEFMNASRQFSEFVDLIKQFARRTNLLALNAAIEAARAGGEARGFAVLADEIRKLANQAGEAAERAEKTTDAVLGQLEAARQAIEETRGATHAIGAVVESLEESFNRVTSAMEETEGWADRVAQVSADVDGAVRKAAGELRAVTSGFGDFAAAMEEMAAGMEEQNASTEEIAGAVGGLNNAALELAKLARVFNVDGGLSRNGEEIPSQSRGTEARGTEARGTEPAAARDAAH
jgi:methyl-accepting chemotaxis protein